MIRMRAERLRRGWSQHKVARLTGIHPAAISRIESGRGELYPGYRRKVAEILNVAEHELLDEVQLEVVSRDQH